MKLTITQTGLREILHVRRLFLRDNNFQIRYNACHERGWTDTYAIWLDSDMIGYSAVKGYENVDDRDTIFEFYILPPFRTLASRAFERLIHVSGASIIECQTNDILLNSMQNQFGKDIRSETVLFSEGYTTELSAPGVVFRERNTNDVIFEHRYEPVGDYVLDAGDEIVATGGFLLHYNMPFADVYMEVKADRRRKGLGAYLVQEIKKKCFLAGRVPAARTSADNTASSGTLLKAGFSIAGFMLTGKIRQ